MTTTSESPQSLVWDHLHHALLVLLICARPLIWDGEPGQPAALVWYVLVAISLIVLSGEWLAGARKTFTWSPVGLFVVLAVLALVPAGLHSPQAFLGLSDLGQLLGHLAFGLYLSQTIGGRERTVIAALLAGLGIESLYALGQHWWVLPSVAAHLRDGSLNTGLNPALNRVDFIERIQNGGIYGTFTLSNSLAAYLLLAVPLAVGVAVRCKAPQARVTAILIAIAGISTLVYTNSKGAWAAALASLAIVGARRASGGWRFILPGTVVLGLVLVSIIPKLQTIFAASADVRLGYWQAAITLIGERPWTGYGLGGFAAEAPRVLAVGAEYSRQVHNEVLEAAVAGGILAAVALIVVLVALLARKARPLPPSEQVAPLWLPAVLIGGVLYLHAFGMLLCTGFPGCGDSDFNLLFALLLALVGAGILALMRQVEIPPWAVDFAIAAVIIHCLQDFDLRSGGVLGILITIACLSNAGRAHTAPRLVGMIPLVCAVLLLISLPIAFARSSALRDAQELAGLIEQLDSTSNRSQTLEDAVRSLRQKLDQPEPGAADLGRAALVLLRRQALEHAWMLALRAPAASDTQSWLLSLSPPSRERLSQSTACATAFPHSAVIHGMLADDLAAAGQWHEALAAARESVRRSPWHLTHRVRLADLLERCAAAKADPDLLAEAQAERARIADLQSQVYFRDRLPSGTR